ncbi:MAG: dodecin family protein [Gemmatimonadales bacterium]
MSNPIRKLRSRGARATCRDRGRSRSGHPGDTQATPSGRREAMSTIVKIIEVIAQSEKGFDDAVRNAVKEASRATVQGPRRVRKTSRAISRMMTHSSSSIRRFAAWSVIFW